MDIQAQFSLVIDNIHKMEVVTFSQAAKLLDVLPGMIRYYAHSGKLPVRARYDGLALVSKADVDSIRCERLTRASRLGS